MTEAVELPAVSVLSTCTVQPVPVVATTDKTPVSPDPQAKPEPETMSDVAAFTPSRLSKCQLLTLHRIHVCGTRSVTDGESMHVFHAMNILVS